MVAALRCRISLLAWVIGAPAGCAPAAEIDLARWPLAGGEVDEEHEATVSLKAVDGLSEYGCSASVIGPRAVLTAKHCLYGQVPGQWSVHTGVLGTGVARPLVDVRMPEGPEIDGEDIAIGITATDLEINAYAVRPDLSGLEPGEPVDLVGFGLQENGTEGTRHTGSAELIETDHFLSELIFEGSSASCPGDSGGTVIDAHGDLVGVIVGGLVRDCVVTDVTIATRVDAFLDLIREALGLGAPCEVDEDCSAGTCLTPPGSTTGICSTACDGLHSVADCERGFYCPARAIDSVCVPGWPGAGSWGDTCSSDLDCADLYCSLGACRTPCQVDADCGIGLHCELSGSEPIGACRAGAPMDDDQKADDPGPVASPAFPDDVGVACSANDECASGLCAAWPDGDACTVSCLDDPACPDGLSCNGAGARAFCAPVVADPRSTGCAQSTSPNDAGSGLGALLLLVALFWYRQHHQT